MSWVAGVDIGTSSAKGVLVDREGRLVARAEVPHSVARPRPGWFEQDADAVWWAGFVAVMRTLLASPGVSADGVAAVAVSAIGPCVLPLDERGRPLRAGILYGIDSRAEALLDDLSRVYGQRRREGTADLVFTTQSVVPKLAWLACEEPEVWKRTAAVVGAEGYLVWRLTGRRVLDIYDAGQYEPLVAPGCEAWAAGWEDVCPPERLPDLLWPGSIAGEVTARAAAETGLAPGTPVMCGLVDAAAEAISVGAVEPGDVLVMLGSTGFFIAQTDVELRDAHLWTARGFEPGRHVLAGGMNTVGSLISWCLDLLTPGLERTEALEVLTFAAKASEPGARGLSVLPYWEGERTPVADPGARGVMLGLSTRHGPGDIYRAVLEGIALGIRDNLEAMELAGARPGLLSASGGVARSRLLLQTIADATGHEVAAPGEAMGAAYGDAMRAAMGAGWLAELGQAAASWTASLEVLRPRPALAPLYDERMRRYRELYRATRALLP